MFANPSQDELREILLQAQTIAVVGLSDNPDRESYLVAKEMQKRGYRIIPVNPMIQGVLGEKAYASLADIPEKVDIVDIFRRSEALPEVVEEAVKIPAPVIWAQQGVYSEAAAEIAQSHGKAMVMDRCIMLMHSLLIEKQK